ncbi:MAG: cupin [Candidatus Melainabacteria bacterium GWA2_34_9]|nr:MAG: cupin [Candidatus Melainabacteria bacterium GWA2_34_9]
MSKITVKKSTEEELKVLGIYKWSTWTCEVSRFNWEYSDEEVCYFFKGDVVIETNFETVKIAAGDLVTFPKGLKCIWDIKKPVNKVYKFNY